MREKGFGFIPGKTILGKYLIVDRLGGGWEGEVYRICEAATGIHRAAKFFFPERNEGNRTLRQYAVKLDRLSACPILLRYCTHERCKVRGEDVFFLVSDLVEGEGLKTYISGLRGKRIRPFEAMHILHELAAGLESIHAAGEYHGDIHMENVLIRRKGIGYDVKMIDFFHRGRQSRTRVVEDIFDIVKVFYDITGGRTHYHTLPPEAKQICCGLKRGLVAQRFPSAARLRQHLESFSWSG
ncbi:MAG: serine/threonine protein kinase [Candidatus Hydrogenedentes bacterium]|nr:serine/threonine protein kinase [Candidatus Hydrogenedentota bacterium]